MMMSNELEKKSEELEQTLAIQLELLKKESEVWLKLGAVVAVGVILTYGIIKVTSKKKIKTTDKAIEVLAKEGLLNENIKNRLKKSEKSSFWPNLTQRLLVLGLALAKDKIYNEIFTPSEEKEVEKSQ